MGFDQLKRQFGPFIIETIEFRGIRQLSFEHAEKVADTPAPDYQEGWMNGEKEIVEKEPAP